MKKRLEKVLSELDDEKGNPDEAAIMHLLDEASSQSDDNGDMMYSRALAQYYLNTFD